jgi:hypothetical protein
MKKIYFLFISFILFEKYVTAQPDSTIVPVRISYINGESENTSNILHWKTACFLSYAKFEIQRSYDAVKYNTINIFSADRLRCLQPFDYKDFTANQFSGRVYYRLKVGDLDGRIYNSKIVAVLTKGQGIKINGFYPTIVSAAATLNISSAAIENAELTIINVLGIALKKQQIKLVKGVNTIHIKTAELPAGRFWLSLRTSKDEQETVQFIKQ